MTRGTPLRRGYGALLAGCLLFGAGILVGHNGAQPLAVPVAQTAPAPDRAAVALPSDAPVANLITLRAMAPGDQARLLSMMTDPQLVALQTVAVTTPSVLPQANDEALSRGLPELVAGPMDSRGALPAVPVYPMPGVQLSPPSPDLGHAPFPDPAPQVSDPCEGCRVLSA